MLRVEDLNVTTGRYVVLAVLPAAPRDAPLPLHVALLALPLALLLARRRRP